MELTIHWFWLIKASVLLITLFAGYKAIAVHSLKSKTWNVITVVIFTLGLISPIKMQPTTNSSNSTMDRQIAERLAVLPPKVSDDSFNQNTNITGITQKDLK